MRFFDGHNHIQDERVFSQVDELMERARAVGVERMGVKGCCEADWLRVVQLMERFEGVCPSFGIHPWRIADRSPKWLVLLEDVLMKYPKAGVGEIGIDHKVEQYDAADQELVFIAQLRLAQRLVRPVTIHCRDAWGRLIELLDEVGALPHGMLIHCFGGSTEVAKELVKRGGYISFSGSITRPNNRKAKAAICAVPEERILVETDAPDLLPHNMGDVSVALNEPANVRFVLKKAAELRGVSEAELAEITFRNATRFFSQ